MSDDLGCPAKCKIATCGILRMDPIPLKRVWESYALLRPESGGEEAFRKVFRDFKCWMRNNPCFIERLHKSPRYKIQL